MTILTEDEVLRVAEMAIQGSGGSLGEHKLVAVVQWACQARVESELLLGVLTGRYLIDLRGDLPAFSLAER